MLRDDVFRQLKSVQPELQAGGAKALFLFGSVARNEAKPNSDIDLFVDPDPSRRFGFDEFMALHELLRSKLGSNVSYTTRDGLHASLRQEIERTAIQIF